MATWRIGGAAPSSGGRPIAYGTKRYVLPFGWMMESATEAQESCTCRRAFTMGNLFAYLSSNNLNNTITVVNRIAGADGSMEISITASGTGVFEDTVNTDAYATGNSMGFAVNTTGASSGTGTFHIISCTCTGSDPMIGTSGGETITGGLTRYMPACGGYLSPTSTAEKVQYSFIPATSITNLQCYVSSNTSGASTLKTQVNGGDGSCSVSISASGTGRFEDTTNYDDMSPGDELSLKATIGSGGSIMIRNTSLQCYDTVGKINAAQTGGGASLAYGLTRYLALFGASPQYPGSTEAYVEQTMRYAGLAKNFLVYVYSNSLNGETPFKLRKNGADTDLGVSVPASGTGFFEENSQTVEFSATDKLNFRFVTGGSSGSLYIQSVGVETSLATQTSTTLSESMTLSDLLRKMPGKVRSDSITLSDVLRRATQSYRREVLRIRDVEQSLYLRITGSADSCRRYYDSSGSTWNFILDSTLFRVGFHSVTSQQNGCGLRLTGVNIPKDATIVEARILVTANDNYTSSTASCYISCENTDNAGVFTDMTDFVTRYGNKTSTIDWANIETWSLDTEYYSVDCKAALQTIVNRSGWTEGNAVVFFVEDFDNRSTTEREGYAFAGDSAKAPRLYVRFLVPANMTTKSLDKTPVTESMTLSDNLTKQATWKRILSDTITLTQQALKKVLDKKIPGHNITLSDVVRKIPMKRRSETITLTQQALKKMPMKLRSETVTLTQQALQKLTSKKVTTHTITMSDILRRMGMKRRSESVTLTQGFSKNPMKRISQTISLSDQISRVGTFFKTLTQSITLTDNLTKIKAAVKVLSESISLSDVLRRMGMKRRSESVSLTDVVRKSSSKTRSESMSLSDVLRKSASKIFTERIDMSRFFEEDFEWGNDGDRLDTSQGINTWTQNTVSGCVQEISTGQYYSGTRSAHIYAPDYVWPTLYTDIAIAQSFLYDIELMARRNSTGRISFYHGNGTRCIRMGSSGTGIFYANATSGYVTIGEMLEDQWYKFEFVNIDFENGYYDMYLDGSFLAHCQMNESGSANKQLLFGGTTNTSDGNMWYDDVKVRQIQLKKSLSRSLLDSFSLSDQINRIGTFFRTLADTVTNTDQAVNVIKAFFRTLSDTINLSDSPITRFISKLAQETITLTDWVQSQLEVIQQLCEETITLVDQVVIARMLQFLESISLSDLDITKLFMKNVTEEVTINQSVHRWIEGYSDDVGADWREPHEGWPPEAIWVFHDLDWPDLYIGHIWDWQHKCGHGYRFTNINIPIGATITSARLRFTDRYGNSPTGVCSRFTGEKSVNGATFSDWDNFQQRRGTVLGGEDDEKVFINDQITWDDIPAYSHNENYFSPELKSIIQLIINQPAWTGMYGANTIVLYWDDFEGRSTAVSGTCRTVGSFNDLGGTPWPTAPENKRPQIYIEYETIVPVTKTLLKFPFTEGINLTPALTYITAWARTLEDTVTLTDAAVRHAIGLVKNETVNIADSVFKTLSRAVSDTINLTQGFFKMPMKRRTESISLSDSPVTRSTSRAIWHTIMVTDSAIRRTVRKRISQTITLTDQAVGLFKFALRVLTENITNTDSLKRFIDKRRSETITLTQGFRKAITKGAFTENVTLTDWVDALKAAFIYLSETINISTSLVKRLNRTFSQNINLTDVLRKHTPKVFSQTITLTESFRKTIFKPFTQSISLTDALSRSMDKRLAENITLAESFRKFIPKVFSQTITLTEYFNKAIPRILTETITLTQGFSKMAMKRLSESITLTQSFFGALRMVTRVFSETITLTQQFGKVVMKRCVEGLSLVQQFRKDITKAVFQENVTLSDVIIPLLGIFRTLQETITNTDVLRRRISTIKTETYSLVGIVTKTVTRTLSDSINLSDLITPIKGKILTEIINITDWISAFRVLFLSEVISLADNVYKYMPKTFSEAMTLMATVTKLTYRTLPQETITLTVQFSKWFGQLIISGGFRTARFMVRKLSSFFSDR